MIGLVPTYYGVFPETFRQYGFPAGAEPWKYELDTFGLDADEIEALAGPKWRDLRLIIVAEQPLSLDSPTTAGGPRESVLGGSWPVDIVHVEARLEGYPAVLAWSWGIDGERLDLMHLEGMPAEDIQRLLRARSVVIPKIGRVGRPRGIATYSAEGFEAAIAPVLATLRADYMSITQTAVAEDMGIGKTTLRACLRRAGVTWAQVQRREWPED